MIIKIDELADKIKNNILKKQKEKNLNWLA